MKATILFFMLAIMGTLFLNSCNDITIEPEEDVIMTHIEKIDTEDDTDDVD